MEEIDVKSLDYGAYSLEYPHEYMSENVRYSTAEFNKLYLRKVRLPNGKGNIIYLLSDSFNSALGMINNKNFLIPPGYRRLFYPPYSVGSFMGRRYKLTKMQEKAVLDKQVKSVTKLAPFPGRVLTKTNENVFFVASDLYLAVKPILESRPIKRNYTEFFVQFDQMLKKLTPPGKDRGGEFDNRLMIIDVDSFRFDKGAPLSVNKSNPLYLLYLAYFRNRDLSSFNINMDMMICSKNLFIKFNPIQLKMEQWGVFRRALFRIMNANLDDYTESLSDEEKKEIGDTAEDNLVAAAVSKAAEPYTKNVSGATKVALQTAVENKIKQQAADKLKLDKELKLAAGTSDRKGDIDKSSVKNNAKPTSSYTSPIHHDVVHNPLTSKQRDLMKAMLNYDTLAVETDDEYDDYEDIELKDFEDDIEDDATTIISSDKEVAEEVLDEIQDNTAPLNVPTAPVNSARDKKLREEQKKVVVGTETIEQILERDGSNVPIESEDKSSVMHTSNKNMTQITFANFDKTYLNELFVKDIVACFDSLKDKDSPFFITGIDVHDTSTNLDYKETWSVHLKDELGKRHTMKVDIPKFQNDRFMLIQGNRYVIHKQNFYNPLVKDTPDTVIITTNYNKVTVTRVATKSLTEVERIFAFMKKHSDSKIFIPGDSSDSNKKYMSTLEYDELSRRIYKFKTNHCELLFSRKYIQDFCQDQIPNEIKGDEFWIGAENGQPILINEDTGLDRQGRTIADIIEANIPEKYREEYNSIKGPTQSMCVEAKMAGEFVPAIVILIVWNGLKKTLDQMGIRWQFNKNAKRVPTATSTTKYIRFADGVLEYQASIFSELMMNGLMKLHPNRFTFDEFESSTAYEDFIRAKWGSYRGINELKQFNTFLIDPITKQVCKDLSLPDTATGLLINAVKMLADNGCVSKASDTSYRVRSIEMIPAILYSCIAAQYKAYVASGRSLPMTLNQRCVISKLLQEKTVEAYSTLNPVGEVKATHAISTKGYKGSNSEFSYDEQKRSYDPTSVGKIAMTTSADANVGISRELTIEPTISNARGYRAPVENIEELKDVNLFSPVEMLTPGTIRTDDAIRSAINSDCRCKTA